MKVAKLVPLFKLGDDNTFNNYRPVSLLPQFSKILEKLFDRRLSAFVEKSAILTDSQYGFRSKRSTSLALIELIEKVTTSTDSKKVIVGVFLDLKKAFDTIDHSVLLQKLDYYSIRGLSHAWLSSYLENRKHYVCVNNVKSELLRVKCSVPQGSILCPKLFILYINDICNISPVLNFILFADDTNLFCTGSNIHTVCKTVTCELDKLNCWFAVNKLSLKLSKTNYMIFTKQNVPKNIEVSIHNHKIERVFLTKFLGVFIDCNLNWKEQILHVKKKVLKSIFIMYKVKWKLNKTALLTLYHTLIEPYLQYCSCYIITPDLNSLCSITAEVKHSLS